MNKLLFGTTNQGKLREAENILGIELDGISLEIDEVQSLDRTLVATKKAEAYFAQIKKPLFIEDTSLVFNTLGNLPGTFIDYFLKELGNDGLLKLLKNNKDRKSTATVCIVYIDKNQKQLFTGETKGTISLRTKGNKGFGWDPIFIPNGSKKTFGEMNIEEKNKYSMRRKALEKFKKRLDKAYPQ
mgnify:CR=1 FL=1